MLPATTCNACGRTSWDRIRSWERSWTATDHGWIDRRTCRCDPPHFPILGRTVRRARMHMQAARSSIVQQGAPCTYFRFALCVHCLNLERQLRILFYIKKCQLCVAFSGATSVCPLRPASKPFGNAEMIPASRYRQSRRDRIPQHSTRRFRRLLRSGRQERDPGEEVPACRCREAR